MTAQRNTDLQQKRLATLIKSDAYDYMRPGRGKAREAVVLSIGEYDVVLDLTETRLATGSQETPLKGCH